MRPGPRELGSFGALAILCIAGTAAGDDRPMEWPIAKNGLNNASTTVLANHSRGPFFVMGAGAVLVALGIVVLASPPRRTFVVGCAQCVDTGVAQRQDVQNYNDARLRQDVVGGALIGGGAATIIGGIVYFLLEPPKPQNTMIAPWFSGRFGGLAATGSF